MPISNSRSLGSISLSEHPLSNHTSPSNSQNNVPTLAAIDGLEANNASPAPALNNTAQRLTEPSDQSTHRPQTNGYYALSPTAADTIFARFNAHAGMTHQRPSQETAPDSVLPVATEHNRWDNNPLQLIQSFDQPQLQDGLLQKSTLVKEFIKKNPDANWLQFCNKLQDFIGITDNDETFVERLELLVVSIQDSKELITNINRIALDSTENCQDAALGSFIEMEKAVLKYHCIEKIHQDTDSDLLIGQVLDLAHGLYLVETLEDIANTLGREEAVEVFLYLLKDYADLLKTPIAAASFKHSEYAEGVSITINGERLHLCTPKGKDTIHKMILEARNDAEAFAKHLASFTPYHEYLATTLSPADANAVALNLEKTQLTAQEISLQLGETTNETALDTIQHSIERLKAQESISLIISSEDFTSLNADLETLRTDSSENDPAAASTSTSTSAVSSKDERSAYNEHMSALENCLIFEFDSPTPSVHAPNNEEVPPKFNQEFLRDTVNNLAMKLYNNAEKMSYFAIALDHATLYTATLEELDINTPPRPHRAFTFHPWVQGYD